MKDRSSILVSQLKLRKPSQLNNSKRYFGKLTDKDNYNKSPETKINKLQVLDIEDVNSLEMCIKNYFAQKSHVLEDKNEAMFQSMIYSLFTNECKVETQTHTIGVQIHSGNGIADIIWYPKEGKSTKAIILEVKYANTFEEMNVKLNEASFQIIEKDYPEKVLTKAENYLLFKNIEFRTLVVFFDKNTNQFEIKSKSYIFEIVEMKRLSYLFNELSKDDRKVLKKNRIRLYDENI
jgi:hypothetical protein